MTKKLIAFLAAVAFAFGVYVLTHNFWAEGIVGFLAGATFVQIAEVL